MPKPAISAAADEVPGRSAAFVEGPTWLIRRIDAQFGAEARERGTMLVMDADEPREIEASDERVIITVKVEMKKDRK
jgi:hypothetical protein